MADIEVFYIIFAISLMLDIFMFLKHKAVGYAIAKMFMVWAVVCFVAYSYSMGLV